MSSPHAESLTLTGPRRRRRYLQERAFRWAGIAGLATGGAALVILLVSIAGNGFTAFQRTVIELEVAYDPELLGVSAPVTDEALADADYYTTVRRAFHAEFPEATGRRDRRRLVRLLSEGAELEIRDRLVSDPSLFGTRVTAWVSASSDLDQIHKGNAPRDIEENRRRLDDRQLAFYDALVARGKADTIFNWQFFTAGDSRQPELAGIASAVAGSLLTLLVCFLISFPVGIAAAIYLEEFASRNRWTDFIEANINNLAAVPSIIFGLLGLAILINVIGIPRGTPLVGGAVLSLMTMPTIIIACRASLRAVPPSIREGSLAMGASPVQVVLHHVLPAAMPGTLTGTIIGLAQALGETAPLLMIGMVAFVADVPNTPLDAAAALPVQIYLWAESAERGFVEKTAGAIIVILVFLVIMNLLAVVLRSRLERRW